MENRTRRLIEFSFASSFQGIEFYTKHGIYTVGLDWRIKSWWPVYSRDYYDGYWTSIHLGPIYFGAYT